MKALSRQKLLVVCMFAVLGTACPAADTPADPPADTMETWWLDLEKNEPESTRALLKFAARPKETVAFFREHLKPLDVTPERVRLLISELGSRVDEIRNAAFEELEYFDPRLAIDLETLMAEVTATPNRQRLVELLGDRKLGSLLEQDIQLRPSGSGANAKEYFNFVSNNASWWAEAKLNRLSRGGSWNGKKKWVRAIRAIVLLEQIGSSEALELLQEMATGHPEAYPTQVARQALGESPSEEQPVQP